MTTGILVLVLSCDDDFSKIGEEIMEGKIVVFPTDTVYGLGTNPRSKEGLKRCFAIKSREEKKPMPILFSSIDDLKAVVKIDQRAKTLANAFWPGKLTMILPLISPELYPPELVGRNSAVAVRIPNDPCAQRLIRSCGGSLIGTSANISGRPPIIDPNDVAIKAITSKCDFFIKGSPPGRRGIIAPSTVVDLCSHEGRAVIVREGAIPSKEILVYLETDSKAARSNNKAQT